jgi:hypothetical protein
LCFSPLRRKTSELEGEEYTSRIVSGIDRLDPPLVRRKTSEGRLSGVVASEAAAAMATTPSGRKREKEREKRAEPGSEQT